MSPYEIIGKNNYKLHNQFSSLKLHNCGNTNEHCWWITPLKIRLKGGGWWLSNMFCCWQICMYWFLFFCVYFAKLQKEKNSFFVHTLYCNQNKHINFQSRRIFWGQILYFFPFFAFILQIILQKKMWVIAVVHLEKKSKLSQKQMIHPRKKLQIMLCS